MPILRKKIISYEIKFAMCGVARATTIVQFEKCIEKKLIGRHGSIG